jgi:putative serine/threonine protein kinase
MQFTRIKQIEKGWSSFIWLVEGENGEKMVLKEPKPNSPRMDIANREGKNLLLANSVGVGPKVFEVNYEKNYVLMEYIDGVELNKIIFGTIFSTITKKQLYDFVKELYRQCLALDTIGLSHKQLQGGKNILVKKETDKNGETKFTPVIIDFEKANIRMENHTKNIGQIEAMFFYNPHAEMSKRVREKLELE